MLDPLADPEMRERAAKLLRLLASDAAGEAEAARAALLRLLARHGTSLDDLTQRLLGPAPDDSPAVRAALAAAERRTAVAEAASSAALATTERLRASVKIFRIFAIAASGAATLLLVFALLPGGSGSGSGSVPVTVASVAAPPVATAPSRSQPSQAVQSSPPAASSHDDHGMGTEAAAGRPPPTSEATPGRQPPAAARRGRVVAPEGVLLRLDPVPGVPSVALLPVGTKVVIDQAFPMLGTDWMQVRTPMGAGFVPASTIKPE